MATTNWHSDIPVEESCHPNKFTGSTDPATVTTNYVVAGSEWLDTTGGSSLESGAVLKQRNGTNTGWNVICDLSSGLAPGGAAGGSLAGTYPNPTIANSVALPGSPTTTTQSPGDNSSKVATTGYVDSAVGAAVAGLSWKQAVRAATTVAGTLASSFANGSVIDGVTLATGDRILIKNQATASENGIYVVAASGAPTRATDADAGTELVNASVYVSEGTTNADTQWTCTTNAPITVGSTSLAFAQLASGGASGSAGGDLTGSYPNPTVANDAVTYAKMQNVSAASKLLGRGSAGGAGDPEEISLGSGLSMSGTTLSATGGGSIGWRQLYARTGGATVDSFVELCSVDITSGTSNLYAGTLRVTVTQAGASGGRTSKSFIIPVYYNQTGAAYRLVPPTSAGDINNGTDDFALEANVSTDTVTLRVRKTAGSTACALWAVVECLSHDAPTFTSLTGTGTSTATLEWPDSAAAAVRWRRSYVRAAPTTVDNYVELCSLDVQGLLGISDLYAAQLRVSLMISGSAGRTTKAYVIPVIWDATAGNYRLVTPLSDMGPYSTTADVALEIAVSSQTVTLRARRTLGTGAANVYATITADGIDHAKFTALSGTGSSAVTAYYLKDISKGAMHWRQEFVRAAPTTVGDYVEVCSIDLADAQALSNMYGGVFLVGLTLTGAAGRACKRYTLVPQYNQTGSSYKICVADSDSGGPDGHDAQLEVSVNANTMTLRIRRTVGTAAANCFVVLESLVTATPLVTSLTGTGTSSATAYYRYQTGFVHRTSSSADPSTTDLPTAGEASIHKNTSSGNVYLAYNDGGSIKKVQLT